MALTTERALRKDKRTGYTTMEHRHFATIAKILHDMDLLPPSDKDAVVSYFAQELECTNPRFDRARFLKACRI